MTAIEDGAMQDKAMARFVNCRLKDGNYFAVLSDGSIIEWSVYCADKRRAIASKNGCVDGRD